MSSKFILYTATILLLLLSAFSPISAKNISVISIGNGNMADYPLTSNDRGCMQMLPMFFNLNVHFNNYAILEMSGNAFLNEGNWSTVISAIREGD